MTDKKGLWRKQNELPVPSEVLEGVETEALEPLRVEAGDTLPIPVLLNNEAPEIDDVVYVDCGDELTIETVNEIYARLKEGLTSGRPLILDASMVQRADITALQMFVALFHEAPTREFMRRWRGTTDALQNAALLLGLAEYPCPSDKLH